MADKSHPQTSLRPTGISVKHSKALSSDHCSSGCWSSISSCMVQPLAINSWNLTKIVTPTTCSACWNSRFSCNLENNFCIFHQLLLGPSYSTTPTT
jgi:hypothetical protein